MIFNIIFFICLHIIFKNPFTNVSKFIFYLTAFYIITGAAFLIEGEISTFKIIALRGAANSIVITFLIFTTPMDDILLVISKVKFISEIVDIAKLMERYVILLEEELELMIKSAKSRGGFDTPRKTIRTSSTIAAMLFINTFNRWKEIKDSINSRGYTGKIYYSKIEYNNSIIFMLIFGTLIILELVIFICL